MNHKSIHCTDCNKCLTSTTGGVAGIYIARGDDMKPYCYDCYPEARKRAPATAYIPPIYTSPKADG